MWAVAKTILKDSSTPQTRIALLNFILLHNPQFEKDSDDILFIKDIIKDLISSPITRNEGYLLLDAVTKSNPGVLIHEWIHTIITSLKNPEGSVSKSLTLRILTRILVNFSGSHTSSEAFQHFIPEIVSVLLKTAKSDEEATNCCKALAVCMQHFPAIVGPHYEEIEKFLMEHADSIDFKTEEGIADCFAAIPICLDNRQKPSYADVWVEVFSKILNTLQVLLNEFLRNCKADDAYVSIEEEDPVFTTPHEEEEKDEYTTIFKRIKIFSSLCKCLAKMMSVHTDSNLKNVSIKVPVQRLLKCLERIFNVYVVIKDKKNTENPVMHFAYPVLQISALSVLESLIINFTVIEHSGNLVTFLIKIIMTTVSESAESWACYVRSSAWKVADAWLKCYGPKSSYNIVNNKFFICELLKDITPDQGSGPPQTAREEKFGSGYMRENCCLEALNVLTSMFVFGVTFMDKDFINEICGTVLKVSCKVHQSSHPAKKFVYPYTNKNCRLNLYQCLLQASVSDPSQTKFVKQAINIFRFASKDPYLEVRTTCFTALSTFRFYIHPKKPLPEALTAQVEPPEEENGWENGFSWTIQQDSPPPVQQEERPMDVEESPPCQIEAVYHHNSMGSDSRMHPTPPPHYADGLVDSRALPVESLCNGSSQTQPSHSNSESEDIREYPIDDEAPSTSTEPPKGRPMFVELRPAQMPIEETLESDDESPQRIPEENGVDEENSDGEEEGSEEEDEGSYEEEDNPGHGYAQQYEASRYSPVSEENERAGPSYEESGPERKRQRRTEEEEQHSSSFEEEEIEETEEAPPVPTVKILNQESDNEEESTEAHHPIISMVSSINSPTVDEMCQDFVLAEPEEIR